MLLFWVTKIWNADILMDADIGYVCIDHLQRRGSAGSFIRHSMTENQLPRACGYEPCLHIYAASS